jgi:hypothetical protein
VSPAPNVAPKQSCIDPSPLLAYLDSLVPGARVVSLTTRTRPRLKAGCPYQSVYRVATRNGTIGCGYESCVNRQRVREGQPTDRDDTILYFEAASLWHGQGEHVGRWLVRHRKTGKLYLMFRPTTDKAGHPIISFDHWYDGRRGKAIASGDLKEWLVQRGSSDRQGVDKPVVWRTIELANVVQIVHGCQIYTAPSSKAKAA